MRARRVWIVVGVLLFVVVATVLIAQPFGGADSTPTKPPLTRSERQATRADARVAEAPNDAKLVSAATLAWIGAADDRISHSRLTGRAMDFPAIARDYRAGVGQWRRFLRLSGGEASGELAEAAGAACFRLTEIGTRDLAQLEDDLGNAVAAERIAGRHNHTLFTLSNVAFFEYFNGEFASGERMAETAMTEVVGKLLPGVEGQFVEYRERAESSGASAASQD